MATLPSAPSGILGEAERCCPALCDYRPEAVAVYLDMLLAFERAGEDPGLVEGSRPLGRNGAGGTAGDGPTRLWDVQVAVRALRCEGRAVTAESVGQKLCPFSSDS